MTFRDSWSFSCPRSHSAKHPMCLPPPELVSPSLLALESHLFAHLTHAPALPGCPEIDLCPEEEVTKEEPLLENKGHVGPD